MSGLRRKLLWLLGVGAVSWAVAQNVSPAHPELDFSHDPCGSPLVESQLWYSVDGKVVSVEDGDTVLIAVTHGHRSVRVHVVGVAAEQNGAFSDGAKGQLSEMILNKNVGVLVNTDWLYQKKKPAEITGVIQLKAGEPSDVGLSLLAKGLVRTAEPRPYTMSSYTFCKYREAETKAKADMLGIWR